MLTHLKFDAKLAGIAASPFCLKVDMLLAMARLPYEDCLGLEALPQAPKGKLPVLKDAEQLIADSEFIRMHLQERFNVDFSGGYNPQQLAIGHAFTRMAEHSLYFITVCHRWLPDENFAVIKDTFFASLPAHMRSTLAQQARQNIQSKTAMHGYGEHTPQERFQLARQDLQALSDQLADKPYLLGETPCFADACVASQLLAALTPLPEDSWRILVEEFPALISYTHRMHDQYNMQTQSV